VAKQQQRRVIVSEDLFKAASATASDAAGYAALTVPIRGRASALRIRVRTEPLSRDP